MTPTCISNQAIKRSITAGLATKRGQDCEALISDLCHELEVLGRAKIHKVDPPTKVVGRGARAKVIHLENPFLDYVGTWTERGGRSVMLEAKSTAEHLLAIDTKKGGLTTKQIDAMRAWSRAGTVTALLWFRSDLNQLKVVNFETIDFAIASGNRSLRWEDHPPCMRGQSPWLRWDFLSEMTNMGL